MWARKIHNIIFNSLYRPSTSHQPVVNSLNRTSSCAYSSIPSTTGVYQVFDRNIKRRQRNRAALRLESRDVDYLKDEVAERLVDRLLVRFFLIVFIFLVFSFTYTVIFFLKSLLLIIIIEIYFGIHVLKYFSWSIGHQTKIQNWCGYWIGCWSYY